MATKPTTESTPSSVTKQVKRLAARFPNLPWETLQPEYARILTELVAERGLANVEAGVTKLVDNEMFLDPAKLKQLIATKRPTRCDRCKETEGWLYILVDGETQQRVVRCQHVEGLSAIQVRIPNKFRPWEQETVTANVLQGPTVTEPLAPLPRRPVTNQAKIPTIQELARQKAELAQKLVERTRMP